MGASGAGKTTLLNALTYNNLKGLDVRTLDNFLAIAAILTPNYHPMQGRFGGAVRQRRGGDLKLADGGVRVRAAGRPLHRDADGARDAHLPGHGAHGPKHPAQAEDGEGRVRHRRARALQASAFNMLVPQVPLRNGLIDLVA